MAPTWADLTPTWASFRPGEDILVQDPAIRFFCLGPDTKPFKWATQVNHILTVLTDISDYSAETSSIKNRIIFGSSQVNKKQTRLRTCKV